MIVSDIPSAFFLCLFFCVLSLFRPFQAQQSVHKGSVKRADRRHGETPAMLICLGLQTEKERNLCTRLISSHYFWSDLALQP